MTAQPVSPIHEYVGVADISFSLLIPQYCLFLIPLLCGHLQVALLHLQPAQHDRTRKRRRASTSTGADSARSSPRSESGVSASQLLLGNLAVSDGSSSSSQSAAGASAAPVASEASVPSAAVAAEARVAELLRRHVPSSPLLDALLAHFSTFSGDIFLHECPGRCPSANSTRQRPTTLCVLRRFTELSSTDSSNHCRTVGNIVKSLFSLLNPGDAALTKAQWLDALQREPQSRSGLV